MISYIIGLNILKSCVIGVAFFTAYKSIAVQILCFSIEVHWDCTPDAKLFSCYNEFTN